MKIPNKFTQFHKKSRKFTCRLNSKISVTGTSCWTWQQLRLIFSSRTHRISIRLHMQDHNIPLSLFIISVYILTVLVLWNIFSKGHVTVTSCLFPQYNPSTLPQKVWKAGKVLMHCYEFRIFCLFPIFKMACFQDRTMLIPKGLFCKYFICSISFEQL